MRALLDVNVLIALLDGNHTLHKTSIDWFSKHAESGWASCPLTQNGCLRILSLPGYPRPHGLCDIEQRMREFVSHPVHHFWPDDLSLLDVNRFQLAKIAGPKQLTDIYLLGLAVQNKGRLVTFDRGISVGAVLGAEPENLLVL